MYPPQDQQPSGPPPPPMQPPPGPQPAYPSQPPPQYQQQYGPPPAPQPGPMQRAAAPGESLFGSPGIEKSRWENLALMGMRLIAWIYLALKVIGAIFALIWSFTDNPPGTPASYIMSKLGNAVNELLWAVLVWALFMVLASIADSLIMLRKGQGRV